MISSSTMALVALVTTLMVPALSSHTPAGTPRDGGPRILRGPSTRAGPDTAAGPAPGEGFYRPSEVALPAGVDESLGAVVRVAPRIRYAVTFYADRQAAAAARRARESRKDLLPGGGVVWHTDLDTALHRKFCANPVAGAQPGLAEVCSVDWRPRCDTFPCTVRSRPMRGSATGFVVGSDPRWGVLVATAYHVARESIERQDRTGGVYTPDPVPAPDVTVGVDTSGSDAPAAYATVHDVKLLANGSEADWKAGRDWALLAIPDRWARFVSPARLAAEPPVPDDSVWIAGFPTATVRSDARAHGYRNADDELRVSRGTILPEGSAASSERYRPAELVTNADAVNGNSGGPALDREGRVIGILHDGTCYRGELNLRIARYCGLTLLAPAGPLREVLGSLREGTGAGRRTKGRG